MNAAQAPTGAQDGRNGPETTPRPPSAHSAAPERAILEDRYDGLLTRKRTKGTDPNLVGTGSAGDYNLLQLKMDLMLTRLCEGTIRDRLEDEDSIGDRRFIWLLGIIAVSVAVLPSDAGRVRGMLTESTNVERLSATSAPPRPIGSSSWWMPRRSGSSSAWPTSSATS